MKESLVWPKRWRHWGKSEFSPCLCRGWVLIQLQKGSWPHGCGRWWQSLHFFWLLYTCFLRFFTSIFPISPWFWLQTFRSLGQMAVVNIQIGCTASVQGAGPELPQQHAPCPSAQHMCTRAEAWLLGWDTEPGHSAAPLEQVEMWVSWEDLFWSDPGLVVGKAWGSSAWLLGALAKVDHHDEVSGLQKRPGWRSCFVSSSVGVQENG